MTVDYAALAPEIVIAAIACIVLVLDLGLWGKARIWTGIVSLIAVLVALVDLLKLIGTTPRSTLGGMFVLDGYSMVFKGLFLVVGAIVLALSLPYVRNQQYEGEYYFLVLCSILGTMLMPSSRDLLMLFISLELVSAPAFVIAGLRKRDPRSNEASLKFFIFGVLSAGVFAYGISLVYGFGGTTNLERLGTRLLPGTPQPLLMIGLVLIIAAFGFKISAVPFHFWAPDTYEGSPTPLAAFLSVSSKAAGFAGLALILVIGFPNLADHWGPIVAVLSGLTMTVGNVVALRQRHLIRLLAYSSIAQAGYMLIPLALIGIRGPGAEANRTVISALVMYLLAYAIMNLGAFAIAIGISKQYPTLLIRDLAGFGRRSPLHAGAMAVFLLSLGGIPPFVGLWAKFFIFSAAVEGATTMGVVLAALMVVNSVISLYYYFIVVRAMFLQTPDETQALRIPALVTAIVGLCLAAVVFFGIKPDALIGLSRSTFVSIGP